MLFNLHHAKEAIRKLEYAILVEGQMDCISVYAAGFHNVIASSGTAFTDAQARLLGRFSHRIVVNFDPDTAGAAAAERSLTLLVEEDFEIKVLTLEAGFDPDLFIRKKGAPAYAAALKAAPRYFDYLIDRARAKFPVRTPEGKVKALNYLLPHIQRVPSRIARMELASEISQKIGIDSAVLSQELKSAATSRQSQTLKQAPALQVTDSERILIRALATQSELHGGHTSTREGSDEEFDPAMQARFALEREPLHHGLGAETLISAILAAPEVIPLRSNCLIPTGACSRNACYVRKRNSRPSCWKLRSDPFAAAPWSAASARFALKSSKPSGATTLPRSRICYERSWKSIVR